MGTWANKAIDVGLVQGHGEQLLLSRSSGRFDSDQITLQRTQAAKDIAEDALFSRRRLSALIDQYDGPEAFLDALAGEEQLERYLNRVLAYAFLHVYARDGRNTNTGRWAGDAEHFQDKLSQSAKALALVAPHSLKQSPRTGGTSGGGALASTMFTSDHKPHF